MVHARLFDKDSGDVLAESDFHDPKDALVFLWNEAEKADHDAGPLVGEIDGRQVTL